MGTKIEVKDIYSNVLFSYESENNTLKNTLVKAVSEGAYLRGVDLRGAYLRGVDLRGADLQGAYLRGAHLRGADLRGAYLQGVDLRGADLRGADLRGAYLRGAYLQGAYLQEAYLRGVDLQKLASYHSLLPEGEITVWKRLRNGLICQLLIPKEAKRVNAIGSRKCRFEYAKVVVIYDGKKKVKIGYGQHDSSFTYRVGEIVTPDSFDDSPLIECSNGIHAFITRIEAEEY